MVVNAAIAEHGAIGPPAGLGVAARRARRSPRTATSGRSRRTCCASSTGRTRGASCSRSRARAPTSPGLQTKAIKDGDEWIVTGQKVWTSTAQLCNLGMLIARTDPDLPKHKGITYFRFDMTQPGVEIRPLREMTGRAMFNEVFIDNARVHDDDIIGGLNNGWAVANTTLMAERAGLGTGGSGAVGSAFAGPIAGPTRATASATTSGQVRTGGTGGGGRSAAQTLAELAKELGKDDDPGDPPEARQALHAAGASAGTRRCGRRTRTQRTGGEPNIAKLMMSDLLRLQREVGNEIVGPYGMVMGQDTPGRAWCRR